MVWGEGYFQTRRSCLVLSGCSCFLSVKVVGVVQDGEEVEFNVYCIQVLGEFGIIYLSMRCFLRVLQLDDVEIFYIYIFFKFRNLQSLVLEGCGIQESYFNIYLLI